MNVSLTDALRDVVDERLRSGLYGYGGSHGEVFIGQSHRFDDDDNPFPEGSGLDNQESDVVGQISTIYKNDFGANYRFQLDSRNLSSNRHEVDAFDLDDVDAIIINVAGCGSMLKDYGHHWKDDQQAARQHFADKVMDISEFLDQLGLIPPEGTLPLQATYHDACHLVHAQGIREQPRNILGQVPDLELIPLPESKSA